jgi:hypothetical protein
MTSTPIQISFRRLHCAETQGEGSSDEIYVIFFIADLGGGAIAKAITRNSGKFGDVDDDETHVRREPLVLWGIDGQAAPIRKPDDVLILVGLMENDESSMKAVVDAVQSTLSVNLNQYRIDGLSRSDLVKKMIQSMNGALDLGAATGGINQDDRLGSVQEFRLCTEFLTDVYDGKEVHESLYFNKDGKYRVQIDIGRGVAAAHGA